MNANQAPDKIPATMQALRAHARGGPEQLVYEDAPTPALPQGADVLVRVGAAAVTFDELTWPETWERNGHDRTPIIPSHELAGVVAAIGPDVQDFAVGDAVFGLVPFDHDGAAAQYVLAPAALLAHKPAEISDVVAAAAVLPALTALEALGAHAHLEAGQRVLVRGGTGAVGSFVTQIAHARRIEVTATVRTDSEAERARRLGATDVLVADAAAEVTPGTFDAAVDAAGAGTPEWLYRAVRPGGRLITLQEPPDAARAASTGIQGVFFVVSPQASEIEQLAQLLAAGTLEVSVAETVPLANGRSGYTRRPNRAPGKTVLLVAPISPS